MSVAADADDETVPTATSDDISTGALFSAAQRATDQGSRTVESEQRAKRKAKKRDARKTKRIKQRQLERQRQEQRSGQR